MLSPEDILDYAARYIDVSAADLIRPGELFAQFMRILDPKRVYKDEEKWQLIGYGLCSGYLADDTERPIGKWVFFEYWDLTHYPPQKITTRLQPPHIVLGKFQSFDRSTEFRMIPWRAPREAFISGGSSFQGSIAKKESDTTAAIPTLEESTEKTDAQLANKIIEFPFKKKPE